MMGQIKKYIYILVLLRLLLKKINNILELVLAKVRGMVDDAMYDNLLGNSGHLVLLHLGVMQK